MCAASIQRVRQGHCAIDFLSVDDAIFAEAASGEIQEETLDCWRVALRSVFRPDSIDDQKTALGGMRNERGLISAFDINKGMQLSLPL